MSRSIFLTFFLLATSVCVGFAQDRDYLTESEIEIIRETQVIDGRIEVLVHAVDRRLGVLHIAPELTKERKEWGELPVGTRVEILDDIRKIIAKAIDDIDNLVARPDSMVAENINTGKKNKPASELLPKAVRTLAASAGKYKPLLQVELDKTKANVEKGLLMEIISRCDEIIAAVAKLPAQTVKKKN